MKLEAIMDTIRQGVRVTGFELQLKGHKWVRLHGPIHKKAIARRDFRNERGHVVKFNAPMALDETWEIFREGVDCGS